MRGDSLEFLRISLITAHRNKTSIEMVNIKMTLNRNKMEWSHTKKNISLQILVRFMAFKGD